MANEHDKAEGFNRSSALSPEQLAIATEAATKAAVAAVKAEGASSNPDTVKDAVNASVQAVFAALTPMLEKMAWTPEKIEQFKAPYIDPAVTARKKREKEQTKTNIELEQAAARARKENCQHRYPSINGAGGGESINITHNFPDGQCRGVCVLCHDIIHPLEYRLGLPNEDGTRTKGGKNGEMIDGVFWKQGAYLVPAHKDYARVRYIEQNKQ